MFYDVMHYHIKLTHRCDKECEYCFDDKTINGKVTVDDFKMLVDKSSGFERLHITMMGGEPLLLGHMMFEECFQYARKVSAERSQQIDLKVITNGSKLNKVWIDLFKRYDVYTAVSYDGKGQHKSEYDNIKQFAADIDVINFTMTKNNYHLLSETIKDMNDIGIDYFDGYINLYSSEEEKPKYIQAFKDAFDMMEEEKLKIKWYLHRDLKRFARVGKTQNRNTQLSAVYLNNDFSLRPNGKILPTVQDSKTHDMLIGNLYDIDHIVDIIFAPKNIEFNKAYIKYLSNLKPEQQLEIDLRGGYLFDKSTLGVELDSNWDYLFSVFRELIAYFKEKRIQ